MTALRSFIVVTSWIDTATTNDHLICINNYINNVYINMYPMKDNDENKEMIYSLQDKMMKKKAEINNEPITSLDINQI